jgi:DNA-binding transcriptional ArsR family regulator
MPWKSIQSLTEAIPAGEPDQSKNLDGLLMAVAEDIIDAVAGAKPAEAAAGFDSLRNSFKAMVRVLPPDVRRSPTFRAGQMSMAVNVLGALANRMPSEAFHAQLKAEGNRAIFAALWNEELRNVDLAKRLDGMDEGQVSRTLKSLQEAGIVVRQRVGREVYTRLSLAARAELEQRPGFIETLALSGADAMHRRMQVAPISVPIDPGAPPPRLSAALDDTGSRTGSLG